MTNQTETKPRNRKPVDPLISGKQLGTEIIGRYSADELLGLPV